MRGAARQSGASQSVRKVASFSMTRTCRARERTRSALRARASRVVVVPRYRLRAGGTANTRGPPNNASVVAHWMSWTSPGTAKVALSQSSQRPDLGLSSWREPPTRPLPEAVVMLRSARCASSTSRMSRSPS